MKTITKLMVIASLLTTSIMANEIEEVNNCRIKLVSNNIDKINNCQIISKVEKDLLEEDKKFTKLVNKLTRQILK